MDQKANNSKCLLRYETVSSNLKDLSMISLIITFGHCELLASLDEQRGLGSGSSFAFLPLSCSGSSKVSTCTMGSGTQKQHLEPCI